MARDDLDDAIEAYRALHWGEEADEVFEVPSELHGGRTLVVLGALSEVEYVTSKGGEHARWHHPFSFPPPLLCVDPETGELAIVGGTYRVTERGIED